MGCTESLPEPDAFTRVHPIDPRRPVLHAAATPSQKYPTVVIVERKLSWSGKSCRIKTEGGAPFGNDLQVKGTMNFQDQTNNSYAGHDSGIRIDIIRISTTP